MRIDGANAIQRAGGVLSRYPAAYKASSLALQSIGRARRRGQIARYLDANECRRLRVGCGSHTDPGWLSVDLLPVRPSVVYMDVTKSFPLPAHSFDFVQCEHVIEHLAYADGLRMLGECHRVLRRGGVLRIATPSIDLVRRLLDAEDRDAALSAYAIWSHREFAGLAALEEPENAVFAANRLVRDWGHTFLYDGPTLRRALQTAGFSELVNVAPGESAHAALRGIDRHQEEVGEEVNELETLALEATA